MKDAKKMIEAEFERRMNLVNDESFRAKCVEMCKALKISPAEWNQNRGLLCLYFANLAIKIEDNLNK